jgi:arginyl-tRNA synthetase
MATEMKLTPMPMKFGVGFVAESSLPTDLVAGYRYEQAGRYHNYHVTSEKWDWPVVLEHDPRRYVIDGFSPNLNKELHVGHLRNLAVANSLKRILTQFSPKFVALLGCSLGVKKMAVEGWKFWTQFVDYHPDVYHDLTLPQDVIETTKETDIELHSEGAEVWDGPKGKVMVKRSDGRPLYAYYDLLFAKEVGPTHYITGHEQKEHFENLGFADKHLPMGLVLGSDGKKMKSRSGDSLSATEALSMVRACLRGLDDERGPKVAWNIAAWNFLHAARETNLKFQPEMWVRPEAPGMYITYTYARVRKALRTEYAHINPSSIKNNWSGKVSEEDAKLLGLAEQYPYYHHKAVAQLDPAPVANFAHDLARALGIAYEREMIRGGRSEFVWTINHALYRLMQCMTDLGLFYIDQV